MRLRASMESSATSCPSMSALPRSGTISVVRMRNVVVLPAPFGPSRPVTTPSAAEKETSSTATTGPNSLCKPRTSITAKAPRK